MLCNNLRGKFNYILISCLSLCALLISCGDDEGAPEKSQSTESEQKVANLVMKATPETGLAERVDFNGSRMYVYLFDAAEHVCVGLTGKTGGALVKENPVPFVPQGSEVTFEDLAVDKTYTILAEVIDSHGLIVARGCTENIALEDKSQSSLVTLIGVPLELKGDYTTNLSLQIGWDPKELQALLTLVIEPLLTVFGLTGEEIQQIEDIITGINTILVTSTYDTVFKFNTNGPQVTGSMTIYSLIYQTPSTDTKEGETITIDLSSLNIQSTFDGTISLRNNLDINRFVVPFDLVALIEIIIGYIPIPEEYEEIVDAIIAAFVVADQLGYLDLTLQSLFFTVNDAQIFDQNYDNKGEEINGTLTVEVQSKVGTSQTSTPLSAELQ